MAILANRPPHRARLARCLWSWPCALLLLCGCQSTMLTKWRTATDDSLSPAPTKEELGDNRNLLSRLFLPEKTLLKTPEVGSIAGFLNDRKEGWKLAPPKPDPEAEKEFAAAEELYHQGELVQAETAFGKLARRKKDHPIGEKAQFYMAEAQYQQKRYYRAHDSYEELMRKYPGTQFLETAVKREYEIGKVWLADSDPEGKPEQYLPWYTAFNGARPLLDPHGFAVKAFEHVRHHDPEGPLADDAALRIAEHYYRVKDYDAAALYFDQLTTDHPKSPLVKRAMLSSIDSKVKGYLGPSYDSTGLEQAKETVKKAKTYFPELRVSTDAGEPDELDHTLDLIDEQMAERTYNVAQYYRRSGNVGGAKYYLTWVTKRWPKSSWSDKAKTELVALANVKEQRAQMSKIMTLPGSNDPFTGNAQTSGMQSGPVAGPNGMMAP